MCVANVMAVKVPEIVDSGNVDLTLASESMVEETLVSVSAIGKNVVSEIALEEALVAELALEETPVSVSALGKTSELALDETLVSQSQLDKTLVAETRIGKTLVAQSFLNKTLVSKRAKGRTLISEPALNETLVVQSSLEEYLVSEWADKTLISETTICNTLVAESALDKTLITESTVDKTHVGDMDIYKILDELEQGTDESSFGSSYQMAGKEEEYQSDSSTYHDAGSPDETDDRDHDEFDYYGILPHLWPPHMRRYMLGPQFDPRCLPHYQFGPHCDPRFMRHCDPRFMRHWDSRFMRHWNPRLRRRDPFWRYMHSENENKQEGNGWSMFEPKLDEVHQAMVVGAGLRNLGNTCFLNAILQCFTHTVPLVEGLRYYNHPKQCECDSEGFCAFCALHNHIELAITSTGKCLSPLKIVENLNHLSSDFRRYQQEDAHELLQCMLDKLDRCCINSETDDSDESLVNGLFGGCLVSKLKCCNCGHCSDIFESLIDVSLEIENVSSLPSALESFTKVEKIEDEEPQL